MKTWIYNLRNGIQRNKDFFTFSTIALVLLMAILLMYKLDLSSKVLQYTSHVGNIDEVQMVPDFTSGMSIRQRFDCYHDFNFITLSFSDHDMVMQGKLVIQILDAENGEPLLYEELEAGSVRYKVPVEISFEKIGGGKGGKLYEIAMMSFDTAKEDALGVYGYAAEKNMAIVNGQESDYALSIGIHSYTDLYTKLVALIFIISGLSVMTISFFVFQRKLKEEHIFLLISVPFALCMLLMWPGNAAYDEARHVNTAYHYSNIILGCGGQDTGNKIMMRRCDVPEEDIEKKRETVINTQAQNYWYQINKMWENAEDKSVELIELQRAPVVTDSSIVQYFPGAVGITLGRILQLNYFGVMTLCRISILIFYIAMCYCAIKIIPVLKMVLIFVASLPMNLYQAAGVTYDSFTFAVGIVVFAYIIKLWDKGLHKYDWIKFGIAVFVLGQCKGGVYLALILLMCFIPAINYARKKWLKVAIIFIIAGGSMASSFGAIIIKRYAKLPVDDVKLANSSIEGVENLHPTYLLREPVEYARMFIQTLLENGDTYLGQMLGYRTAWSNVALPIVVMLPFLVILIFAVLKQEDKDFEITMLSRIGIFFILLVELVGMHAIFLTETPVYSNIIIGFQGRYFVLFLPCILLLFRNQGMIFKEKKEYLYPCFVMTQMVYLYFFLGIFMQA